MSDPAHKVISVIIPARNSAATLPMQLDALASQTYEGPWELVIADNGSTDGTAELAPSWSEKIPDLKIIDASANVGANHARNAGAKTATGAFLLFCDADDVVTPTWLEAMVEHAGSCDLVGGRLETQRLNAPNPAAWRFEDPWDELPVTMDFLPYAVSANFGISSRVFEELGGWDTTVHGGDDVEFCWRAQLAGYKLCFASDAVVLYRYRADVRSVGRQFYEYGLANSQLYRAFRDRGVPRSSIRGALRSYAWLTLHLHYLVHSTRSRGLWIRNAAHRWGRLRGSIRQRVVFL